MIGFPWDWIGQGLTGGWLRIPLQAHRIADDGTVRVLVPVPAPLGRGGVVQRQHAVPKARLPERGPGLGSHKAAVSNPVTRTLTQQALKTGIEGASCAADDDTSPSWRQQSADGQLQVS